MPEHRASNRGNPWLKFWFSGTAEKAQSWLGRNEEDKPELVALCIQASWMLHTSPCSELGFRAKISKAKSGSWAHRPKKLEPRPSPGLTSPFPEAGDGACPRWPVSAAAWTRRAQKVRCSAAGPAPRRPLQCGRQRSTELALSSPGVLLAPPTRGPTRVAPDF